MINKYQIFLKYTIMKSNKIKCPICLGWGFIEKPYHSDEREMKRICAVSLHDKGYSFRQIMRILGYKSQGSVQLLLNNVKI